MNNNQITIKKDNNIIEGKIKLSGSKSETNRVLILNHLCPFDFTINNESESHDSKIMRTNLSYINNYSDSNIPLIVNAGNAGTVARFLTALLAITPGKWLLTGDSSLQKRPIKPLVDALTSIGANIEYTSNEDHLPIRITGKKIIGGTINIDSSISSQFITALMLIAPTMDSGLQINLENNLVSKPYIQMTKDIMEHFGISTSIHDNSIIIKKQEIQANDYTVDGDWSSASYWFEMASIAEKTNICLQVLQKDSKQGDEEILNIFKQLNIESAFDNKDLTLTKQDLANNNNNIDFSNTPDLAQATIVACAVLGAEYSFTGLDTLVNKETNRIQALKQELEKIGIELYEHEKGVYKLKGSINTNLEPAFDTYNDHRMAMCLAPLALIFDKITINDPEVVNKSYPEFWKDLKNSGFQII